MKQKNVVGSNAQGVNAAQPTAFAKGRKLPLTPEDILTPKGRETALICSVPGIMGIMARVRANAEKQEHGVVCLSSVPKKFSDGYPEWNYHRDGPYTMGELRFQVDLLFHQIRKGIPFSGSVPDPLRRIKDTLRAINGRGKTDEMSEAKVLLAKACIKLTTARACVQDGESLRPYKDEAMGVLKQALHDVFKVEEVQFGSKVLKTEAGRL